MLMHHNGSMDNNEVEGIIRLENVFSGDSSASVEVLVWTFFDILVLSDSFLSLETVLVCRYLMREPIATTW